MITTARRAPLEPVSGNTPETRPINLAYFPALDGLRGAAFLVMFSYHYLELPWGWTSIDTFFILSGFLITGILVDMREDPHRVRNFYIRRTLRIFPLYYGVILLLALLYPVFHWDWTPVYMVWPLYLGNLVQFLYPFQPYASLYSVTMAHVHSVTFPRVDLFFGHFWTLCIEEQFYLLWPWVVFSVTNRKKLMYICAAFVVACPLMRAMSIHLLPLAMVGGGANIWFTPFRIDTLLLGALLALVRRGPNARMMPAVARTGFVLLSTVMLVWLLVIARAKFLAPVYPYPAWSSTWGLMIVDWFSACLIVMALEYRSVTFRIFNVRPLRWLGRISYGAYVFHDVFHAMFRRFARHYFVHWSLATALIALAFTLLISWASYRWFESPFIRMKSRWSR
ncbi:MAG TPA: acyltransferase [Acidobacteriaceae bacterium]